MIKITIAGDFVPQKRGTASIIRKNAINQNILDLWHNSDLNIINLECPIVTSTDARPICKEGPALKTDLKAVEYLKECGIHMVTLANNHIYDYGMSGMQDTVSALQANNILYVGGGMSTAEATCSRIITRDNIKIAVLNFCEHEFSIATRTRGGANPINPIQNYYSIQQAKKEADYTIVIVHGGIEGYPLPTPFIKELYRFYAAVGADAVIGHHPHCISGFEIYDSTPIFYSLGNFFFDNESEAQTSWNTGLILQLIFDSGQISYKIHPVRQCAKEARTTLVDETEDAEINRDMQHLCQIIADDQLLAESHRKWIARHKKHILSRFLPYSNKYLRALYRRNMFPSFMNEKQKIHILNAIQCESHRQNLIEYFTGEINEH